MNRQGHGKIDWTDYTWNPVTGCLRDCWYCYVKRLRDYDRRPTFHPDRLDQPLKLKKPSKIFVCSTADLFAEWNQGRWIEDILRVVRKCPQHTFQFLTKSPEGYRGWKFPGNCWLGVTLTDHINMLDYQNFDAFLSFPGVKFVSHEPLIRALVLLEGINWVIFGAMTGKDKDKHRPQRYWIERMAYTAKCRGIAVFMKDNLKEVWGEDLLKEWPNKKPDLAIPD